jgi:hypothetical protein
MAFRRGMKIVCIDAKRRLDSNPFITDPKIKVGEVYTVRDFDEAGGVRLEEVRLAPTPWKGGLDEPGFNSDRFRPVAENKRGMEILRAILANPKQKISEREHA